MQPDTFRTLAEYIHELRRRDWDNYTTREHPAFDTTIEDDHNWNQGNRGRDAGRGENSQG
jgi:hypothetical protein